MGTRLGLLLGAASLVLTVAACGRTSNAALDLARPSASPDPILGSTSRSAAVTPDAPGGLSPAAVARTVASGFCPGVGDGPVYAVGFGTSGILRYGECRVIGDGWHFVKVLWVVRPTYDGPITIQGHQTDGSGALHFELGSDQPVSNMLALPAEASTPGVPLGCRRRNDPASPTPHGDQRPTVNIWPRHRAV